MYSKFGSQKSGVQIPFSTNWQQLAIFIATNKNNLSQMDLYEAQRRLKGALDMNIDFNNGMGNVGTAASIGTFINTYRNQLPASTVQILMKKSQGFNKLGFTQIKGDMTMELLRRL